MYKKQKYEVGLLVISSVSVGVLIGRLIYTLSKKKIKPDLENICFTLKNISGEISITEKTNNEGIISFSNIPIGTYIITES